MMKRIWSAVFIAVMVMTAMPVWAQGPLLSEKSMQGGDNDDQSEIKILSSKELAALDDDKLTEVFIDVLVEIDAAKVFHSTSGFTPKQYKKYKELLKYRMWLLWEVHRRKIEIPAEFK